ncbi:MAG: permease [Phycisphaerae bacterium]|nr:MAG: permease [Phycisphaerae bacterium]
MTDWTIISRSLNARRFSTITTIVMVAVGVALMVVLLTMRDAGRQSFQRGTGNVHLLVSRDASPLSSVLNGLFYAAAPPKPVGFDEYETLRRALPLEWAIPVQLGDSYKGAWPVLATAPEFFTRFQPAHDTAWTFASGRAFEKNFEIVLGSAAARGTGLRLGSKVVLTHGTSASRAGPIHEHDEAKYEVVGILQPTGTIHDRAMFTNLTSSWLIHALDRLERAGEADHDHAHDHDHGEFPICEDDLTAEDRKITNIYIRVATRPGSDVSSALPVVMERIRRDPAFQAAPFTVAGPRAEVDRLLGIVGNVDRVLVAMAFVVMLSSAVGIMLALYNSMEQRRRQVAILRVLGASQGRVFSLVLTESAFIGLIGAGAGLLVGLVAAQAAAGVLRTQFGVFIAPAISLPIALGLVLGTVVLACVAGLVPAAMAYRTSVAVHLKPAA